MKLFTRHRIFPMSRFWVLFTEFFYVRYHLYKIAMLSNGDESMLKPLEESTGSMFDVMGAKAAGCICAWSNRQGEPMIDEKYKPDYELTSLSDLLEIL